VEPNPPLGKVLQSEEPNQQDNFAPLFIKVDVDFDTFPELSDSETDALISEIYNEDMDVECVFAS